MQIQSFKDDKSLKAVRLSIENALEEVRKHHGLKTLRLRTIGYAPDGLSFTSKIEAEIDPAASPEAAQALKTRHNRESTGLGFNKNIVGEKFMNGKQEFTVTELKLDRPKWPIIATDGDKSFKFQANKRLQWIDKTIEYKYDF